MKSQLIEMNAQVASQKQEAINPKQKGTAKGLGVAVLALLAMIFLAGISVPASAQCTGPLIYTTGGYNGWYQNGGPLRISDWPTSGPDSGITYAASQSFKPTLFGETFGTCLEIYVWHNPGKLGNEVCTSYPKEAVSTLYWSVDSTAFGQGPNNVSAGHGTAHYQAQLHSDGCFGNEFGYEVWRVTIKLDPIVPLSSSKTYFLNLSLGTAQYGNELYWDVNGPGSALMRPPGKAGNNSLNSATFSIYMQ